MEEISGQDIRVILSIKQGRGFGYVSTMSNDGIYIEATLNGSSLDTDVIPISEEPIFDSELMWESDKKMLRRLRTSSTVIKIQCFSVDHTCTKKDRIGNFIMSLRQAHIVASGKSYTEIGESWCEWQKLNGSKTPPPELLCSLRFEEKPKMPEKPLPQPAKIRSNRQKAPVIQPPPNPNLFTRLHTDKGIIQIGSDETAVDHFVLTIYVGQAVNLDLLLPGNYNPESSTENEQLCFHYSIMDYSIKTANIAMSDIYKPVPLNEKMVISLCSSLENLQQYFSASSKLFMKLLIGQDEVGFTEMSMQKLIPTTNKAAFCSMDEDNAITIESACFLRGSKIGEVPTSPSGLQPYVNLRIKLKYQDLDIAQGESQDDGYESQTAKLLCSASYTILDELSHPEFKVSTFDLDDDTNSDMQSLGRVTQHGATGDVMDGPMKQNARKNTSVPFSTYKQASGDVTDDMECMTKLYREIKTVGQNQMPGKYSASSSQLESSAALSVTKNYHSEHILHDISTQTTEKNDEPYHTYSLDISVSSIAFLQLPPHRRCFLKFHHPKAEVICNAHPQIKVKETGIDMPLEDITCNLTFVSTPGEINRLLLAWPPKISACDNTGDQFAIATLNIAPLLVEEMKRCHCSSSLIDLSTREEIGTLALRLNLEDHGLQLLEDKPMWRVHSDKELGPAILDDRIAFKIVEELEDWKERQQELFREELKKKEQAHLSLLCEEWDKRRGELEKNLNRNVEQCKRLAHSLNETTEELRTKASKNAERESELGRFKEVTERKHMLKVLELKEAARRVEDDLSLKITRLEREKEDLQERIVKIEKENLLLQETIAAQEQDMDKIKKTSLTKDQTASLLQEMKSIEEKLESALKSKSFFKEQWARAVREIHRIKCEHQQGIQIQIKHNKEELRNLGFQNLLGEGEKEFQEDQSLIQQLRSQVSTMQANHGLGDGTQRYSEFISPHTRSLPNTISLHSLQGKHSSVDFTALKHRSNPSSSTNLMRPPVKQQDENDARLKALVEERDALMNTGNYTLEDPAIYKLNQEIRKLLIHSNGVT